MTVSTVSIGLKHTTSFDISWFVRMFCLRVSSGGSCNENPLREHHKRLDELLPK